MIDIAQLQFICSHPLRHGDGSFQFEVIVLAPSSILGQPPDFQASAKVHVQSDKVCMALGEALKNVAQQLPPEIATPFDGRSN